MKVYSYRCWYIKSKNKVKSAKMTNKSAIHSTSFQKLAISLLIFLLSACSSTLPLDNAVLFQDKNQRAQQLVQLEQWTIRGKIAFIDKVEKQSANFYWQHNADTSSLKLTTFLGVNVLTLTSEKGMHVLKANGKTYQDTSLEALLTQVAGITLPMQSLVHWLKGIKAQPQDEVLYSSTTQLPKQMNAWVNEQYWQITYGNYDIVKQYRLANKLTIKHRDLTIKMLINSWDI